MKNLNYIKALLIFLLGSVFLFSQIGCVEEPIELGRKEKAMVDTLVVRQTKLLRPELDSLCDLNFDARVQAAADSILMVRVKEIEKIIKGK